MDRDKKKLATLYLLRKQNSIEHLNRFINSYCMMNEPLEHDLVIIFKGYTNHKITHELKILQNVSFIPFYVDDVGFDIAAYLNVARNTDYSHMLFLNSFSEFRAPCWLTKLNAALSNQKCAGVVGASGSYEPTGLGTPFPNYHIRTTGFFMSRSLLLNLELWSMYAKEDTSRFEAGPNSLTQQLLRQGLEPYIVDINGICHAKEEWPSSNTYRSGNQEKLLIADNRTNAFLNADPRTRLWLARLAWQAGDHGPSPSKQQKLTKRLKRIIGF